MPWKNKVPGYWIWRKNDSEPEMIELWLTKGDGFRFWSLKFHGFGIYVKKHNIAFQVAEIVRKHLHNASKEVENLIIKYDMILNTNLRFDMLNQLNAFGSQWYEELDIIMQSEIDQFSLLGEENE